MALMVVETNGRELRIYENADELSVGLAEYIAKLSEAAIKERGVFAVALSGGSLIHLMRKLCLRPHSKIVDWAKWHVFWSDERLVSRNHDDSNHMLAEEGFLKKVSILLKNVHPVNVSAGPERAAWGYEFSLRHHVRSRLVDVCLDHDCPRFDLVLLEAGPDGHVASLFPGHPALDNEDRQWVTFVTDSPVPPPERVTFTLPVINSAANVVVVATGGGKAEVVRAAIGGEGNTPAGMVVPYEGKLVWFVDVDAGGKVEGVEIPGGRGV